MGANTIDYTAEIVANFVANNSIDRRELPALIASVDAALKQLGKPVEPEPEKLSPPVPIKKSVTRDYIVSLEDGKPYRTLKRHLGRLGLTPDEYRAKWNLPADYPMVAPSYAEARSALAKNLGLGRKRVQTPAPRGRGR